MFKSSLCGHLSGRGFRDPFGSRGSWLSDACWYRLLNLTNSASKREFAAHSFIFGKAFGVYLSQLMFLTRSVFITDPSGIIQHIDIVTEFTHEPEYDAAIDVLAEML